MHGVAVFLVFLVACSSSPAPLPTASGDGSLALPDADPNPGDASVGTDLPIALVDAAPVVDATPNPVCSCPVPPMDQLYSGPLPPNPYGMLPMADGCIAKAHDVIVVLGCPNNSDGTPSACQKKRADLAIAFSEAGYGDWFITSGGAVHNQYVEGDTLKALLVAGGVAADHVFVDAKANHTDENLYYSTKIMEGHGFSAAIVISDDAGHLVLTGVCDSNCCVDLGRLTVLGFSVGGKAVAAGHYVRYPWANKVTTQECSTIQGPFKAMCINQSSRLSCATNFQLALDGGTY